MRPLAIGLFIFVLAGCSTRHPDAITQVSTIDSLLAGVYDGHKSLGELKRYGDFGLGTFDRLDGEMIFLDGKFYKADASGKVTNPPDNETTPFATVVHFNPERSYSIAAVDTHALESAINSLVPEQNRFVAIRVDGEFDYMRVRSVPAQQKPYPMLVEVTKSQPTFDHHGIRGTLVGFRSPAFVKGFNVPGYHWHFISDDRRVGGHVLDLKLNRAIMQLDRTLDWLNVFLPSDSSAFSGANLTKDRSAELDRVERER